MPYPSKISQEAIVEMARQMIEEAGVDRLLVNTLAARLEVKTPSLYRYVDNKTDLLRAVNEATFRDLFAAIGPALESSASAEQRTLAIAHAYRDFAHAHPITYGLAYTNTIAKLRPDDDEQEQAVLPFQALMAEISGDEESLPALRGLMALIHGFVMLELAGQFRRGGDLNAAFEKSVRAYIAGWRNH